MGNNYDLEDRTYAFANRVVEIWILNCNFIFV